MIGVTPKASRKQRRHVLKYAASTLAMANIVLANTAIAQTADGYATDGAGQYKNQIVWFSWGSHDHEIPDAGVTQTNTYTVAGRPLSVTCTLSNISGTKGTDATTHFRAYAPGNWRGDGLDDMYNQGKTEEDNEMAIGLVNAGDRGNSSGDFTCSATYDGQNYELEGLVFADAESTNSGESIGITLPAGATFRFIEGFRRTCTKPYEVEASAAGVYTFKAPDGACDAANTTQSGPMGIGFIDGATSASFHVTGGGKQAIALGVMTYIADTGDAPATYGSPSHIPTFTWQGGEVARGTTASIFSSGFTMATPVQPDIRLGARVDVETRDLRGDGALGDDNEGDSDEDALSGPIVTELLVGGRTFTVADVSCTATPSPAPVYGYIDFNRNNVFDVATERSNLATCSGIDSTVNLNWTVPNDVRGGASYLRIRIAANSNEIASPTSLATSGEVEDHAITLATSRVKLTKTLTGRVESNDQFTVRVEESGSALTSAVTTGTGNATNGTATTISVPVTPDATTSLIEVASNGTTFTAYDHEITCENLPTSAVTTLPTLTRTLGSDSVTWTYTPVAGQDLACTVTNTGRPHVNIAKSTLGGFGQAASFTATNLSSTLPNLTTSAVQTPVSQTGLGVLVSDATKDVVITEAAMSGYALTSAVCTDAAASATGNPASFGTLSDRELTLDEGNLRPGARILCTFTNSKLASVSLNKTLSNGRYFADDQFVLNISDSGTINESVTTTGSNSAVTGTVSLTDLVPNTALELLEDEATTETDLGRYTSVWACTNASVVSGAQTPNGTGTSFTLTPAAGDDLTCSFDNQRKTKADLSVTKTNTPAAGASDQANDVLYPGDTTTYVVTIRNDGPDDYTGAVVRDPAPAAPLVCPASVPVTCSGPGCPNGLLTLGQLQDAGGLILGTIPNGGNLTLSYSCTVE